ncbi:MAG: hypothetical protein HRF51_10815 [bacterium]|jgi:hypothetical protein
MRNSRSGLILLVVIYAFLFSHVSAGVDRSEGVRGIFGLKYGILGGGYIKVENVSGKFEKESGQSLGITIPSLINTDTYLVNGANRHEVTT